MVCLILRASCSYLCVRAASWRTNCTTRRPFLQSGRESACSWA
jgi:hypothetical protein